MNSNTFRAPTDNELEIIGFDGYPRDFCDIALPVMRDKTKGLYFSLTGDGQLLSFSQFQINDLIEEKRMTRLVSPVPFSPDARILYITEPFLRILKSGSAHYIDFFSERNSVQWQKLPDKLTSATEM